MLTLWPGLQKARNCERMKREFAVHKPHFRPDKPLGYLAPASLGALQNDYLHASIHTLVEAKALAPGSSTFTFTVTAPPLG